MVCLIFPFKKCTRFGESELNLVFPDVFGRFLGIENVKFPAWSGFCPESWVPSGQTRDRDVAFHARSYNA